MVDNCSKSVSRVHIKVWEENLPSLWAFRRHAHLTLFRFSKQLSIASYRSIDRLFYAKVWGGFNALKRVRN